MKNKEDPSVRNKIHRFKDLKKQKNFPLDLNFSFGREGVENVIHNNENIPKQVKKASSVFYISDPEGLSQDELNKASNCYDLIIRDASKDYSSFSLGRLDNTWISIFNSYSNLEENFKSQTSHTFWLGKTSPPEIPDDCEVYESNETFSALLKDFTNRNSLSLKRTNTISTLVFLLKCFDVVHCYGLDYGSKAEDHAVFGMHFLGLITLKSLYDK